MNLFGKPVLLNFKGSRKSQSKIGVLFTLLLVGFGVWLVYYFGREIVRKKDPSIVSSELYTADPPTMTITQEKFPYAFAIVDPKTQVGYINESIYLPKAYQTLRKRTIKSDGTVEVSITRTPLKLEACQKDEVEKFVGDNDLDYNDFAGLNCVGQDAENPVTLEGLFSSEIYRGFVIEFYLCDSSTSSVICGSDDEVKAKFASDTNFLVNFGNTAMDLKNYDKPISLYRDNYNSPVNPYTMFKEVDFYLQKVELTTDKGWLVEDFEKSSYIMFQDTKDIQNSVPSSTGPFARFVIKPSSVTRVFNRSYIKVQDIAAKVNGIFSVALIILIILLSPYANLKFYETLINELFMIKLAPKVTGNKMIMKPEKLKILGPQFAEKKKNSAVEIERRESLKATVLSSESPDTKKVKNLTSLQTERIILLDTSPNAKDLNIDIPSEDERNIMNTLPNKSAPTETGPGTERKYLSFSKSLQKKPSPVKPILKLLKENVGGSNLLDDMVVNIRGEAETERRMLTPYSLNSIQESPNLKEGAEDILLEMVTPREKPEKFDNKFNLQKEQIRRKALTERNEAEAEENLTKVLDEINFDKDQQNAKIERLRTLCLEHSEKINLSFSDYLRSFLPGNKGVKQKIKILQEGIKRIDERLENFNVLKKLRELDKLKFLLIENEQLILFEGLPKPELSLSENQTDDEDSGSLVPVKLKDAKFITEGIKADLITDAYYRTIFKSEKNKLDRRLLSIYEQIMI